MDPVEKRRARSRITSRMMVTCLKEYAIGYGRKHVGSVAEEMLVAWVIWQDDHIHSIAEISKELHIPRSNVVRALGWLREVGLVTQTDSGGWIADVRWSAKHLDDQYFKNVCDAILRAADDLRRLD